MERIPAKVNNNAHDDDDHNSSNLDHGKNVLTLAVTKDSKHIDGNDEDVKDDNPHIWGHLILGYPVAHGVASAHQLKGEYDHPTHRIIPSHGKSPSRIDEPSRINGNGA
jgi:hypothetical protein